MTVYFELRYTDLFKMSTTLGHFRLIDGIEMATHP